MSSGESVTHWIHQLKGGDAVAAQKLWERYFDRLVGLARKKLQGARRRAEDEEDVALSVFDSLCRGAQAGRFPLLADRDNLWRLLVVITARKAIDLVNRERRLKRGGGKVEGESAFAGAAGSSAPGIEQVVGDLPTPAFAAQVAEQCQRLLDQLADDELRAIAVWKMEGHTNEEIAAKLDANRQLIAQVARAFLRRRIATLNGRGHRQRPRLLVSANRSTTDRASASPPGHSGRPSASRARCRSPAAGTAPYASSPPETTDSGP
jgi:DNA-directed RNA polymerase specialized sigma24 family protein